MKVLVITQKVDVEDDVLGFFVEWIRSLSIHAEYVEVLCLAKGSFNFPSNVRVYSLGKESGASKIVQAIRFYLYAFRALLRVDGVFVHMAPEYVRALFPLNIFFRKPLVMWYAHIRVSPLARWAIRHVHFVLTPSKESFEFDSPKIVSTGHGINATLFSPEEAPLSADLLSLSRISKVKRIETLIEAMNILINEKHIEVTLDIYGSPARVEDGAYLQSLKKKVADYKLEKYIFWKGSVANKDAPHIYASHNIFVRMQGGGGFGKTELEAMSMGVPAILPTPVYKNDLGEFANDLYFQEGDAAMLASKIESVRLWSKEKRAAYRRNSRSLVVLKHNVENIASMVVSLLKQAQKG